MHPDKGGVRLSSEVFGAIVAQAPDAIVYADRDGVIQVWNHGAEALFGFAAQEVLGQSMDLIIPERFRGAHWQGYRRAIEAGETRYAGRVMTTRATHKGGGKLYVDLSFGLIKNDAGAVIGVLAVGRDATARYVGGNAAQKA